MSTAASEPYFVLPFADRALLAATQLEMWMEEIGEDEATGPMISDACTRWSIANWDDVTGNFEDGGDDYIALVKLLTEAA